MLFPFLCVVIVVSLVSDLHEEGKNAINAPMLPTGVDIHPEDTLLGIYTRIHYLKNIFSAFCSWLTGYPGHKG